MRIGKIYEYIELWELGEDDLNPMSTFRFRDIDNLEFAPGVTMRISDFAEEGKIVQKDMLEMLYPRYPWDMIIKLYNEAPRSQK